MSKKKVEEFEEEFEEDIEDEDEEEEEELQFSELKVSKLEVDGVFLPEEQDLWGIYVTKQTLASILGLSTRRIEQLIAEGLLDPPEGEKPKKYNLYRGIILYRNYLKYGKDYV